ncbi:MAG: carboxypeptidase regulatory-like domain-containing protein [Planctomycetaceae bacterium]|nr:carboxypeptidase regulatory-like domain-containing protein [Planctomycetaceae bacterium]
MFANHFVVRVLLGGLLLMAGCGSRGPRTYPVTGEVVFEDGVALQGGIVEFTAIEQEISSSGRIGPDGTFRLTTVNDGDGAVAGEQRAIVISAFGDGLVTHNHDAKTLRRPAKKFANYKTSGLKFTVCPGEKNHFQVVIERAK